MLNLAPSLPSLQHKATTGRGKEGLGAGSGDPTLSPTPGPRQGVGELSGMNPNEISFRQRHREVPFPRQPCPRHKPLVPHSNFSSRGFSLIPPPTPLPHPLTSYLVSRPPPNPHFLRGQDAISIFLSPTAISQLFTGTTRIKRDNLKIVSQQLSGWGGGGAPRALGIFFFSPFQKGKLLESFIFSKAFPNSSQTACLGVPQGNGPIPPTLSSQGRACHQPPKSVDSVKARQGARARAK